jgi:hypothetical protein
MRPRFPVADHTNRDNLGVPVALPFFFCDNPILFPAFYLIRHRYGRYALLYIIERGDLEISKVSIIFIEVEK